MSGTSTRPLRVPMETARGTLMLFTPGPTVYGPVEHVIVPRAQFREVECDVLDVDGSTDDDVLMSLVVNYQGQEAMSGTIRITWQAWFSYVRDRLSCPFSHFAVAFSENQAVIAAAKLQDDWYR